MRLWSLHPQYLDTQGLLALWREGLLAQKVLLGKTKGYKNHPQLNRFKAHPQPFKAIANYLHIVCDDAGQRGYSFNRTKINQPSARRLPLIQLTTGQLEYEYKHLKKKLLVRDRSRYLQIKKFKEIEPQPLFKLVQGEIADWERVV